jgi:hypothetical protein
MGTRMPYGCASLNVGPSVRTGLGDGCLDLLYAYNLICLGTTCVSLDDVELNFVALLEALVTFGLDGAEVNKDIWPVRVPEEPESLCVIEPLNFPAMLGHIRPASKKELFVFVCATI